MNRYFVVLCEDLQAWCFVYRALIAAGANARNIFRHPYPDSRFHASGGGSPRVVEGYRVYACGSQHVLMNYAEQLAAVRTRRAKRDTALVVHVDVDNATAAGRTVLDRERELDAACAAGAVGVRRQGESVAWLIPRREIETWITFFLSGPPVDEHTAYPKLTDHEADSEPAAVEFTRHARAGSTPTSAPPSLASGLAELRRVI